MIKDLERLPNGKHAAQHFKTKIRDYEKKFLPCKTLHREQDMISIYEQIIDRYETRPVKLIAKVLRQHNAFNSTKNFLKKIEQFNMKFEEKFEQLKEFIHVENKEFSEDLQDWFKQDYQTESGAYNKFAAVANLPFEYWFVEQTEEGTVDRSAIKYVLF